MNYYVALGFFFKIGAQTLKKGLERFGSIQDFYTARANSLGEVMKPNVVSEFVKFRESFPYEKKISELQRNHISVISFPEMPDSLKNISDPPLCLFVKGSQEILYTDSIFAIVGTRKVSSYGRQITTLFSNRLAENNIVIISGMALGVDTLAHQGCLDAGGKTIAVLGCGVDIIYPGANRLLYQRILSTGGTIISEFPPGYMPQQFTFVLRNRLISGLSRGTLVVEGTLKSGSMITARYAVEQGKDVFAVPMPLLSSGSAGPNSLLKQGAKLVLDPTDIMAEYCWNNPTAGSLQNVTNNMSHEERLIIQELTRETMSVQAIIKSTKLNISLIMSTISNLELSGVVQKTRDGRYEINLLHQSALSDGGTFPHEG